MEGVVHALYQQHQAIAKRLAELNAKSEDELLEGLVKMAQEVGLQLTVEELKEQMRKESDGVLDEMAGGPRPFFVVGADGVCASC